MFKSSARLLLVELVLLCLAVNLCQWGSSAFLLHDDMGYGRFRLIDGSFLSEDFEYYDTQYINPDEYEYESYHPDEAYHHSRWPRSLDKSPQPPPKFKASRRSKMTGIRRHVDRI